MSLINDALKKAQRDRSGEHPPASPPERPSGAAVPPPAAPAAQAAASSGFKGWPMVAVAAVIVVGVVAWRVMSPSKTSEPVAVADAPVAETPVAASPAVVPAQAEPLAVASSPIDQTPAPTTETVAEIVQTPVQQTPVVTPPPAQAVAESQPVIEAKAPPIVAVNLDPPKTEPKQQEITANIPPQASGSPSATQTLPATLITIPDSPVGTSPAAPMVSVRQQDPRVLAYLDAVRVNGIRPSPDDPKVLMNGRVFRINDVVDRELNLRLTEIAPSRLTFEDARGMPYVKNF